MQASPKDFSRDSSRRAMLVLMSLTTLYQYMYCMIMSSSLSLTPIFGGALFMSSRVATTLAHTLLGDERKSLPRKMRVIDSVLLGFMLLCLLLLLAVYPMLLNSFSVWILFTIVLLLTMRAELARRLMSRVMRSTIGKRMFLVLFGLLQLAPIGIIGVLFMPPLPMSTAVQAVGGFALSSVLECYTLWRERKHFALPTEETPIAPALIHNTKEGLRQVNAYLSYQRFHTLILMALQITLVMVYTFVGLATEALFSCLLLSVTLTLVMRELADFLLKGLKTKRPNPIQLLLIGLFLWIYGLVLFYLQLGKAPSSIISFISLGLSVTGLTVSITCLAELERQMTSIAQFGLENQLEGYTQIRTAATEMAILVGQMGALVLLTLLCIPAGFSLEGKDIASLARNFRPLMILPPLLLLIAAAISVLHFPINHRYFQKLRRFLTLKDKGGDNPALEKQLDNVVVQRHKNRFVLKIIIALLRPLYSHTVIGKENIAAYEEGSIILVCNHGEIYGPVVAHLFVPVPFRPWVISNMMDKAAMVEHMYEGTMIRQKWLPIKWKKPLVKLISPLFIWLFESLDGIPVYRGNPRELLKTFRLTAEAMQAGDNILLFPENGETHEVGAIGYAQEGVGDLYTGFAMLAPVYYRKTRKNAVFIPIYGSKRLRTLTIGEGIVYNPHAPATDEKLRIVQGLHQSMQDMYMQELEEVARRNEERRKELRSRRRLNAKATVELERLEQEVAE